MADETPDPFEALLGWQRARILKALGVAQRPSQVAESRALLELYGEDSEILESLDSGDDPS
jgi:hypothetical protein